MCLTFCCMGLPELSETKSYVVVRSSSFVSTPILFTTYCPVLLAVALSDSSSVFRASYGLSLLCPSDLRHSHIHKRCARHGPSPDHFTADRFCSLRTSEVIQGTHCASRPVHLRTKSSEPSLYTPNALFNSLRQLNSSYHHVVADLAHGEVFIHHAFARPSCEHSKVPPNKKLF